MKPTAKVLEWIISDGKITDDVLATSAKPRARAIEWIIIFDGKISDEFLHFVFAVSFVGSAVSYSLAALSFRSGLVGGVILSRSVCSFLSSHWSPASLQWSSSSPDMVVMLSTSLCSFLFNPLNLILLHCCCLSPVHRVSHALQIFFSLPIRFAPFSFDLPLSPSNAIILSWSSPLTLP